MVVHATKPEQLWDARVHQASQALIVKHLLTFVHLIHAFEIKVCAADLSMIMFAHAFQATLANDAKSKSTNVQATRAKMVALVLTK